MPKTWILPLSVGFLLFLQCPRPSPTPTTYSIRQPIEVRLVRVIGPHIVGTRPLNSCLDVEVNSDGEIFIADFGNDRVVKLDRDFRYVGEFGGFGRGELALNGPQSVAADNTSNIYVVDSGNARVVRLDRRLSFVGSESVIRGNPVRPLVFPTCIEIDHRGDIYLGDAGMEGCFRLDPFFSYVLDFAAGGESGVVRYPIAIACDRKGQVYIADRQAGRVVVFNEFGSYRGLIGQSVLQKPHGLAISRAVWISDANTKEVLCFSFDGQLVLRWRGDQGLALDVPAGICFGPDDIMYVADSGASCVFVIRPVIKE